MASMQGSPKDEMYLSSDMLCTEEACDQKPAALLHSYKQMAHTYKHLPEDLGSI
jgi:hypothetical protein